MKQISVLLESPNFLPCFTLTLSLFSLFDTIASMSQLMQPEPFLDQRHYFHQRLPESRPLSTPPLESSFEGSANRSAKFFPYFLVQFPNDPCTNLGGNQHGVCVSAKDCRAASGVMIGTCAQGFGACCQYIRSCSAEGGDIQVRENSTEIRSGNGSSSCRFILPKARGICQVRLDFLNFQFGTPSAAGDCGQTKVEISGGTMNFSNICGNNTGQHFLVNYGEGNKIYVYSGEPTSPNDTYSIRISYIRCDSRQLVPSHCSQYYTGMSGQVRSLNWPHQQLNNQEYTVCVADARNVRASRREKKVGQQGSRKIKWSTCGSSYYNGTRDFFVSGKKSDILKLSDPTDCDITDYIQIFGGNKQCGNQFRNETVTSPPYLLRVRFDRVETTNVETMMSSQGYNAITVNKPDNGCQSLDTDEVKCLEVLPSLCKCSRMARRPNSKMESIVTDDEGNTGFCLSYKIVE